MLRLIDFNIECYHAALFRETFESAPDFNSVHELQPQISHVPMATAGFLNYQEVLRVGHQPLSEDDLLGYRFYLDHIGLQGEALTDFEHKLIAMSESEAAMVRLFVNQGTLDFEQTFSN